MADTNDPVADASASRRTPPTAAGRGLVARHEHYDVCRDDDCLGRQEEFAAEVRAVEDAAAGERSAGGGISLLDLESNNVLGHFSGVGELHRALAALAEVNGEGVLAELALLADVPEAGFAAAWRRAEAALPAGWSVNGVSRLPFTGPVRWRAFAAHEARATAARAPFGAARDWATADGATKEAALDALAAELDGLAAALCATCGKGRDETACSSSFHAVPTTDTFDLEADYRRVLWESCPHPAKYGDDGEMQCAGADFVRDELTALREHVQLARLAALNATLDGGR
jgi:hypothetical protein